MSIRYELGACPACAGHAAAVVANSAEIRDEVEQLWAFHTRRLRGETPADRLQDRVAFSQSPPLQIVRCERCTLLYRNPRERQEGLLETYSRERPDSAMLRTLLDNQRDTCRQQAARLTREFGHAGTGLEVGSYVGGFLAAARDEGWTFAGLDVNEHVNDFARSHGFDVMTGTITEIDDDRRYDVVAFWNCFDQLPDPAAAARAARQRVRDGGMIAVRVPNGEFYRRVRRWLRSPLRAIARAALAHNNLLGFPYRHGFSPTSLNRLLHSAGFDHVRFRGDTLVPVADAWTRDWATVEEQAFKTLLRTAPAAASPWIEAYATAI